MTIGKNNKLMSHLNHRMKVVVQDSRTFVGYFKAFDKHMNIILSECEEHRRIKAKPGKKLANEEEKRVLGLVLLRGDKIISISVEGPPQKDDEGIKVPKAGGVAGPGVAKPAARGVPVVPPQMPGPPQGLQGVVHGMGGPGMPAMQPFPQMGGNPMMGGPMGGGPMMAGGGPMNAGQMGGGPPMGGPPMGGPRPPY